jgi:glycosyltransferase involved in cell wall biosynthesis
MLKVSLKYVYNLINLWPKIFIAATVIWVKSLKNSQFRICILTSARVFEAKYGGEGKFAAALACWLAQQNYEVILMGSGFAGVKTKQISRITERQEQHMDEPKDKPHRVKVLYPPYVVYLLSRLVIAFLWILKIISSDRRSQFSLIHAQDTGYSGLAAVVAGRILRVPVILSSHGIRHKSLESTIHSRFKNALLKIERRLDMFTIRRAKGVIADNPTIKKYLEDLTSRTIDFIPIPIKTRNFQHSDSNRRKIRQELGIANESTVIGFVGRFSAEKNVLTLINSCANLLSTNHDLLKLVLVGTGPLESELKEYVAQKGIREKVVFCGIRYDIDRILSGIDIFVLPSYTEGLSVALLEAMASGKAIICSDIPANRELIEHGREGLLINPDSFEDLQNAILLLSKDARMRSYMGGNATIKASNYDEDVLFPRLLHYYQSKLCIND